MEEGSIMKKYCNILDENTGLVEIGVGCPDEYYIEIGMEKRNVKLSDLDNQWYLEEKCPSKPEPTAKEREKSFKTNFFKVEGFGYYRRQPKGYTSAIESINTAYNMSKENNGLPAGVLIFYPEPNFTDAEQCTEEWLVAHQIILPAQTLAEFISLYNLFIMTWNTQEHN